MKNGVGAFLPPGRMFVRVEREGKWQTIDALDMTGEEFRRFVLAWMLEPRQLYTLNPIGEEEL